MAFTKGSVSLSRFSILRSSFDESNFEERIVTRAFDDFFPAEAKEKWGWALIDDPLSTDFTRPRYQFGPYLLFTLRVDRRRIPAPLLKIRCLEGERRVIAEAGQPRLSREQKMAIREAAWQALAARIPPIPSFYEVCWIPAKATVYFNGTTPALRDDFISYFDDTFAVSLLAHQSEKGPQFNRDFLTWLWAKTGERDDTMTVSRGEEIRVSFVKRLLLESGEGEYTESMLCQGIHTDFSEVEEALREGKKIKEARLSLQQDKDIWEFTLKADDLVIQGMRLPESRIDNDAGKEAVDHGASLLERVYLIERALGYVDDLMTLFKNSSPP